MSVYFFPHLVCGHLPANEGRVRNSSHHLQNPKACCFQKMFANPCSDAGYGVLGLCALADTEAPSWVISEEWGFLWTRGKFKSMVLALVWLSAEGLVLLQHVAEGGWAGGAHGRKNPWSRFALSQPIPATGSALCLRLARKKGCPSFSGGLPP